MTVAHCIAARFKSIPAAIPRLRIASTGPHTGRDIRERHSHLGLCHHPFRCAARDVYELVDLSTFIIQTRSPSVNESFTRPSSSVHALFMIRGGQGTSWPALLAHSGPALATALASHAAKSFDVISACASGE